MKLFKLLVLGSMMSSPLMADSQFRFKDINLMGEGCPQGTFSVVESPDEQTVSIIFDQFSVEVPNGHRLVDSKGCNIHVSTILKDDERVDAIDISVDYRGFVSVEGAATAQLQTHLLSWEGPQRGRLNKRTLAINERWSAGVMDDWFINKTSTVKVNSNCARKGDDIAEFRLKNTLMAAIPSRGNTRGSLALLTFDSSDLKGEFKLKLKTKTCKNNGPRMDRRNSRPRPTMSRGGRDFSQPRPRFSPSRFYRRWF